MKSENCRRKDLLRRANAWLHKSRSPAAKQTLVMLPKRAACCGGKLLLSLPPDFQAERTAKQSSQPVFSGTKTGLRLTVMQMQFTRPLKSISALDLQVAFRKVVPISAVPKVQHGFCRHSPALTAEWEIPQLERGVIRRNVLHLIQQRGTVFLLFFENITPENTHYIPPMLFALELRRGT